jgi:hypothetical protein
MEHVESNYTYSEFLEISENGIPSTSLGRDSRKTGNRSFYNSDTFEEALNLAKFGWKDSFKMVELSKNLSDLIPVSQFKETFVYDVSGSYPDVGKYLTGEPENMVEFITEEDTKKISLVINASVSWQIDQKIQFNKGASVVSLINKLEDLGYRVSVDVLYCVTNRARSMRHDTKIRIKEYHEQVDIDRIAFIFCNVAFSRRVKFSVNECSPIAKDMGYHSNSGYGLVSEICETDQDIINSYDISLLKPLIPNTQNQFESLEKSSEYVVQIINEYLKKQKERV